MLQATLNEDYSAACAGGVTMKAMARAAASRKVRESLRTRADEGRIKGMRFSRVCQFIEHLPGFCPAVYPRPLPVCHRTASLGPALIAQPEP